MRQFDVSIHLQENISEEELYSNLRLQDPTCQVIRDLLIERLREVFGSYRLDESSVEVTQWSE